MSVRGELERLSLLAGRGLVLGTLVERLARIHGERVMADEAGSRTSRITYREAADKVARLADGIAGKSRPGQPVVVAAPNGYEFLLLCLAVSRAGGIAVPVNPKMSSGEVDHVIADSGADLVIRNAAEVEGKVGHPAVAASPREVAAIFYTSGTTGKPKGARLTHAALLGGVAGAAMWPSRLRRDEAVVALPVAHIMGFAVLLSLGVAGVPVYFLPRFRPDATLDAIESRRATMFVGVPAMYRMMLEAGAEKRDLRSVRLWASGADVMPPDVAKRFKQFGATVTLPFADVSLGQAAFAEGYGMVELGGGVAAKVSPPYLDFPLGDSVGFALPRYRLKVVDEDGGQVPPGSVGELWVKGPGVLEGYHGDVEATRRARTDDGWLRTGDLARRGPLGTVLFAGRSKDVIKHGGYSVFAVEVERALEEHPAIAEAAVLGLPDATKGEVPVAVVRLQPGADLTPEQILIWVAEHLADYKRPQQIRVVDDLPRTGTDKVQKDELRPLFA